MAPWDHFFDLLFPKRCLSCGMFGQYICQNCSSQLPYIHQTICPMCTKQSPFGITHPQCKTRYSLDGLTSVYRYTGPIRKAIKMIKYQRTTDLVPDIVRLTIDQIAIPDSYMYSALNQFINTQKPIIIPIPLHLRRLRQRWFNQSELLAREIGTLIDMKISPELLKRIKFTKPQADLKREERLQNIKGAFAIVHNSLFKIPHSVLLFDDVWTTGSTMREVGNVLKRAGVKKVWALTVAR